MLRKLNSEAPNSVDTSSASGGREALGCSTRVGVASSRSSGVPRAVYKSNFSRLKMPTSSRLAALATLALLLALASAQGPECKTGPHPTVLAVQQKCAKGSLLCKEVQVTNCVLILSAPHLNLKPQTSNLRNLFTIPNVSLALRSTSFPSTWTLPRPSKKFSTHQVRPAFPPAARHALRRHRTGTTPLHWHLREILNPFAAQSFPT